MTTSNPAPSRADRWLPWIAGAVALGSLAWCSGAFAELWWFGDDWGQLDEIARMGFWRWTFQPFAENFVPLFKILWGGMVFAGGGSYFPMMAALWVNHAVNVALLARLLRRTGFGWPATALVLALFALTPANLETLAWSVQWSAILATTFFLAAADWHARQRPELQAWSWRVQGILALLVAASALSFSRGVLTGLALALIVLAPIDEPLGRWLPRLRTAAACLVPALAVVLVIFFHSGGNQHRLGEKWIGAALEFGLRYWSMSPLNRLIAPDSWVGSERTTLVLAALKLVFIVGGLRCSHGPQRRLLGLLLLLDLGNAALLGLGRYHTELITANSSRYQYNALLCTLPFVGRCGEALLPHLPPRGWRAAAVTLFIAGLAVLVAHPWLRLVDARAGWRGRNLRALLLQAPAPGRGPDSDMRFVPLSAERARELVAQYHLH